MALKTTHQRCVFAALVCCFWLAAGTQAKPLSPQVVKAIDALIAKKFPPNKPGVAVLIVQKDQVLYKKTFGLANVEKKIPLNLNARFDLASVSKHFTAAAVLRLIQQRKLSVKDDLRHALKKWAGPNVTIEQLLAHHSGLADYTSDDFQEDESAFRHFNTHSHALWMEKQKFKEPPGTKYRYNNSGYAMLAEVVESKTGMVFSDFMKKEFFHPLGMTTVVYDKEGMAIPGRPGGYLPKGQGWKFSRLDVANAGDGNVFVTLDDMAKWESAWWTFKIFPKAYRDMAWSSQGKDDEGYGYGWGMQISNPGEPPWVAHDGSWMGTASYLIRDVKKELSLFVVSNNENADPVELEEAIYEELE